MKRFFFAVIFCILSSFSSSTKATETTFSGEIRGETKEKQITESVRKLVEEKVQQLLTERKKIGWLGTIQERNTISLTIETRKGAKEILFSEDTKVVNLKSQSQDLDYLTEGKKIVALGYQQGENILEARRIIVVENPSFVKVALLGRVSDKSTVEKLLVITPANDKDQTVEIIISSKTKILNIKNEKVAYENLEKGQRVGLVYKKTTEDNLALLIKIL